MEMVGYANRRIPLRMAELLGVKPAFSASPGQIGSQDRHCAELSDYLAQSAAFVSDCRVLDGEACGADDHVLVPHALAAEMYGLARWLDGRAPAERPR